MPAQLVAVGVPIEFIQHLEFGIFFRELFAAVLLRDFKSLVRVHFQEIKVERGGGAIIGIEIVFNSMINLGGSISHA